MIPGSNSKLTARIGNFRSSPRYGVTPDPDGSEVCNCSASKRHQFLKRLDKPKRTMVSYMRNGSNEPSSSRRRPKARENSHLPRFFASPSKERNYGCACGRAWTRRSGFKCKVLPAATYTFLSNCVRPGARTFMS